MTPHIEAKLEEIAKKVLMPGDPKRAEWIAKNYLKDAKIVNEIRGMTAYTGYYKDELITVFPSGMGMPSMGIYSYELFNIYNVDTIIRIGTCGSYSKDLSLLDVVMAQDVYTISNFTIPFGDDYHHLKASQEVNDKILLAASNNNITLKPCNILTSDVFDPYIDAKKYLSSVPYNVQISEMEAFALLYMALKAGKKATCLATVVDTINDKKTISAKDREQSLNDMVKVALEALTV